MELMGVRLVGFNEETLHKLVLTVLMAAGLWLTRRAVIAIVRLAQDGHVNPRSGPLDVAVASEDRGRVSSSGWQIV
jgi:hypothetical protein